jgi:Mrp family chromosome partitioning ATPase
MSVVRHNGGDARPQRLDPAWLRRRGLLAPGTEDGPLADSFRALVRQVRAAADGGGADPSRTHHVVLVTSAAPREGKTFVAANLSLAFARDPGRPVLLVDADLRRPSILRELGLQADLGLSDVLADPALDPADATISIAGLPGFAVLAAGRGTAFAPRLPAARRVVDLVAAITTRHPGQVTIIDTPPVLGAPETAEFAAYADQVLLVVAAERTDRDAIEAALDALGRGAAPSIVLNQTRGRYGASMPGRRWFRSSRADAPRRGEAAPVPAVPEARPG